jgi:hypothetical protein
VCRRESIDSQHALPVERHLEGSGAADCLSCSVGAGLHRGAECLCMVAGSSQHSGPTLRSAQKLSTACLLDVFSDTEDGGRIFPRKAVNLQEVQVLLPEWRRGCRPTESRTQHGLAWLHCSLLIPPFKTTWHGLLRKSSSELQINMQIVFGATINSSRHVLYGCETWSLTCREGV